MTIARRIVSLARARAEFLKNLVRYGGVCTRTDAQRALGIESKKNAQRTLGQLVDLGLLEIKQMNVGGRCYNFFFPTREVGRYFGVLRSSKFDLQCVVAGAYRFAVAQQFGFERIVNVYTPNVVWPGSRSSFTKVKKCRRDDPVFETTVVLAIPHIWTRKKALSNIRYWLTLDERFTLQIWCSNQTYAEKIYAALKPEEEERVNKLVIQHDTLVNEFSSFIDRYESEDE